MGELLFSGGTVATAEGSYRADVLVEDDKIVAVAAELEADGAEVADATGKLYAGLHRRPHPHGHALRGHRDGRRLGHGHRAARPPAGRP